MHRVRAKQANAFATVTRRQADVAKAETSLGKAKTEAKVAAAKEKLDQAKLSLKAAQEELAWLESRQGLRMKLWDGHSLENRSLIWQSKRLSRELTPTVPASTEERQPIEVTRANRLAQAAGNADEGSPLSVIGLFDLEEWNGRLQAPRDELNRIADIRDGIKGKKLSPSERITRVEKMISRLHWLVTYSAKLQPQGPWLDYAAEYLHLHENYSLIESSRGELVTTTSRTRDEWRGLTYPFWHPQFESGRAGRSRHILSHLPDLRVFSVDLGHRHAAACAVWETLSGEDMQKACKAAGQMMPDADAMFCLIQTTQPKPRTTVYRRIGPDSLDGKTHPAPWARLDRQFLIKLQGEDRPARSATREEFEGHNRFREFAGLKEITADEELDLGGARLRTPPITRLTDQALRDARLALRRLSDRARIAYAMTATHKPGPGGRTEELNDGRIGYVQEALLIWHRLAASTEFVSSKAREWWDQWIVGKLNGPALVQLPEEMSRLATTAVGVETSTALAAIIGDASNRPETIETED